MKGRREIKREKNKKVMKAICKEEKRIKLFRIKW